MKASASSRARASLRIKAGILKLYFDHEKLIVYQKSLLFIELIEPILQRYKYHISAIEHLDEASTSVSLNIAEGTGKFTPKDKCKFFDISRGSALECASALDVLIRKKKISTEEHDMGKKLLYEIVSMLIGLIKSKSDRVYESEIDYNTNS